MPPPPTLADVCLLVDPPRSRVHCNARVALLRIGKSRYETANGAKMTEPASHSAATVKQESSSKEEKLTGGAVWWHDVVSARWQPQHFRPGNILGPIHIGGERGGGGGRGGGRERGVCTYAVLDGRSVPVLRLRLLTCWRTPDFPGPQHMHEFEQYRRPKMRSRPLTATSRMNQLSPHRPKRASRTRAGTPTASRVTLQRALEARARAGQRKARKLPTLSRKRH